MSTTPEEATSFGELLPASSEHIEAQHAYLHDRYAHLGVALMCGALDDVTLSEEDRHQVTVEMMVVDALLGRETLRGSKALPVNLAYRRTFGEWRARVTRRLPALDNTQREQFLIHAWMNVERILKKSPR